MQQPLILDCFQDVEQGKTTSMTTQQIFLISEQWKTNPNDMQTLQQCDV